MKWTPRSISGQLFVVWVLAMLATHGIAVFMMSLWRADNATIHPLSVRTIETRVLSAYRVATRVPDAAAILADISVPDSSFRLGAAAAVAAMNDDEGKVADGLRKLLQLPPQLPIAVRLDNSASGEPATDKRNWLERMLRSAPDWTLHIEVPLGDGRALLSDHRPTIMPAHWGRVLTFSLLVGMIPTTLIAIFFGRRIMRPLQVLTEASKRVSRGEPMIIPAASGPNGVREITAAFNEMQKSLTLFVSGRTQMLAAMGHDLRTPLTSLRIRAEMVEDEALSKAMVQTLDDMKIIVDETLQFARNDALQEPTLAVWLDDLIGEVVDEQRMQGRAIHFDSHLSRDDALFRCRAVHLKRALNNLIDNGARYGAVRVSLRLDRASVRYLIEVADHGPGIAEDQLEHVFEPFVRLDAARSRATGGAGLGLAIARSCSRAHGGDVTLANRPEGGLTALIHLPA